MYFFFSLLLQILLLRFLLKLLFRRPEAPGRSRHYYEPSPSPAPALANAYRTLGVSPQASDSEVKSAYKRLALHYHPDRYATSGQEAQKQAEEKFKLINEAYQLIKRKRGMD